MNQHQIRMNLYRGSYFLQGIFGAFVALYISVYFAIVEELTPSQISWMILIGQAPLLLKPVIGRIAEWKAIAGMRRKPYLMLGAILFGGSLFVLSFLSAYSNYFAFIFLFAGVYLGMSFVDVSVDGIVLDRDQGNNYKTVANMQLASIAGSQTIGLLYNFYIADNVHTGAWGYVFAGIAVFAIPILILSLFYKEKQDSTEIQTPLDTQKEESTPVDKSKTDTPANYKTGIDPAMRRVMLYFFTFLVLMNFIGIVDFLVEPYIVRVFGDAVFRSYGNLYLISYLAGVAMILVLYKYRSWVGPRRNIFIIISGTSSMLYLMALISKVLILIYITTVFMIIFSQVLYFCYVSLLIDCTPKANRAFWYQIYAVTVAGSRLAFKSLGPLFGQWFSDEGAFWLVIPVTICIIPILLKIDVKVFQKPNVPAYEN
jgi:MFS family permease